MIDEGAPAQLGSAIDASKRHLVPLLFTIGLICLLDRASVGYAALTMNADLGLSTAAFGLGAGIFFLGYVVFEVPSNLLMHRVGPRLWIARIALTWGVVMLGMAFIRGEWSFYAARLLLGLAEAGLFPAVYFLIGQWFPSTTRGRVLALFLSCNPVAGIIGGPIAGAIFAIFDGSPVQGWRVMFFVLGLPAIAMAFVFYARFPNSPAEAAWLDPAQRQALADAVGREHRRAGAVSEHGAVSGLLASARNPFVWAFTAIFFLTAMANYGVILFLPQIVRRLAGTSPAYSSLLSAIPYVVGLVSLLAVARSSDLRQERRWHLAGACVAAAIGLFLTGLLLNSAALGMVTLCVAVAGVMPLSALIMTRPTALLSGTVAAAGIAIVNSVGSIGGFVGPYLVGWVQSATGSFYGGLVALSLALVAAAAVSVVVCHPSERRANVAGRGAPRRGNDATFRPDRPGGLPRPDAALRDRGNL